MNEKQGQLSDLLPTKTLFSVGQTNMVPTTVALHRVLSWMPTPIALWRLHVLRFGFAHTQAWVWAPLWPLKTLARGSAPWSTCQKKRGVKESISTTQGAAPKRGSPYPELEGPNSSVGVRIPNSRGQTEARECITPT